MKRTALLVVFAASAATAQIPNGSQPAASKAPVKADTPAEALASVPNLNSLISNTTSELAPVLERYSADLQSVNRRYDASDSPDQRARMRNFYSSWRQRLTEIPFDKLKQEGKVDYVLLDNRLKYQLALLDRADKERAEVAELLPFADKLLALQDRRRDLTPNDPVASARTLAAITKQIDSLRMKLEASGRGSATPAISKTVANRAAADVDQVRNVVGGWYRYYDGYDPLFTWWAKEPYTALDAAMTNYARTIRTRLVGLPATGQQVAAAGQAGGRGAGGGGGGGAAGGRGGAGGGGGGAGATSTAAAAATPIIGDPIGESGLAADLAHEMIPYTPQELMAIAEKEYAFSLSEAKKAAREMGLGDDWKAAMEKVKNTYVEPGKQPELIRELARQAEEFFAKHDWITIPDLA